MTTTLVVIGLVFVGVIGTAVTIPTRPGPQAVMLSALGLLLAMLFMLLEAPDVALSQVGVGAAIVPLMVMLTVRKIEARR